jgi:hypothetical protein
MDECIYIVDKDHGLNYGQIFFMVMGMLPFMLCLPPLIVTKCIWEPMEKERQKQLKLYKAAHIAWKKRERPYETKYPVLNHSENKPKMNNIIIEKTPDGHVAMRYNAEENGFEYWSDKAILYKYLETVARKYVNTFYCTDIYIDRRKHLKEKINKLTEEIKENIAAKKKMEEDKKNGDVKDEDTEEKTDVFASLKTYNKNIKTKTDEKEKLTRDDYVCDIANKYIKKGKFSDSKKWISEESDEVSMMSWLSWKNTTETAAV